MKKKICLKLSKFFGYPLKVPQVSEAFSKNFFIELEGALIGGNRRNIRFSK